MEIRSGDAGSSLIAESRGRSSPLCAAIESVAPVTEVRIAPPVALQMVVTSVRHAVSLTAVDELLEVGK